MIMITIMIFKKNSIKIFKQKIIKNDKNDKNDKNNKK